jgi:hypothetical protein
MLKFRNGDRAKVTKFSQSLDGTIVTITGAGFHNGPHGNLFYIIERVDGVLFERMDGWSPLQKHIND